jgi:hypothetical protein
MGGLAFADEKPPLLTPRMPPAVYTHTRDDLLCTLHKFYAQAECPIEAPAKTDYGDIDILVAEPLSEFSTDQIALVMGAVKHKTTGGSPTTHFAVRWPKLQNPPSSTDSIANDDTSKRASDEDNNPRYIQVDLHVCSPSSFPWELFHQAHGDIWNILGSTVRPLGLTPSNSGLYIRIEEIEAHNKKGARVRLTTSPSETLRFLGLDEKRYWQKFETVDELFAYAARCRFFNPRKYDPVRTRGELKANDRARVRKRAVFRRWVEEYLPAHGEDDAADEAAAVMSRGEVVEDAKRWFGVAEEYEERRMTGLREIGRDRLWTQIRKELSIGGESVGAVMRGVKREAVGEKGQPEAEMTTLQRAYAADDFETVVGWVRNNWKEVEDRQRAYGKEKSTMNLSAKLERLRAEGKADSTTRLGKVQVEETGDEGRKGTSQSMNDLS